MSVLLVPHCMCSATLAPTKWPKSQKQSRPAISDISKAVNRDSLPTWRHLSDADSRCPEDKKWHWLLPKTSEKPQKRISVFSQVSFCFVCRRLGLTFFRKPQWQVNESLPRSEIQILLRVHSVGAKDGDKNTLKITSMWVYSMYVTLHVPKLLYCILYAHCIFPFGNIFFLIFFNRVNIFLHPFGATFRVPYSIQLGLPFRTFQLP